MSDDSVTAPAAVRAYVGLGGNLDDPAEHVTLALAELDNLPATRRTAQSSLYVSRPLGSVAQPDYVNAVAELETRLPAGRLLDELLRIENRHGRRRDAERWGPRTLDLDLLLYGRERIASEILTVPHPGLAEREFVLYPLYEIVPDLDVPDVGSIAGLLAHCPRRGLRILEPRAVV